VPRGGLVSSVSRGATDTASKCHTRVSLGATDTEATDRGVSAKMSTEADAPDWEEVEVNLLENPARHEPGQVLDHGLVLVLLACIVEL
jgi:hypothetical protein